MSDESMVERAREVARNLDRSVAKFLLTEYDDYDILREHLPIARTEKGQSPGWFLTRYEHCVEALKDFETFSSEAGQVKSSQSNRKWIPQGVDPPEHTAYRHILHERFTPKAVDRMDDAITEWVNVLLDRFIEQPEFEFIEEFADPFPVTVFCRLMGFSTDDLDQLVEWKNIMLHTRDGHPRGREAALRVAAKLGIDPGLDADGVISLPAYQQIAGATSAELYGYFQRLLDERRAAPRDDLISDLLAASYNGERPLTQHELEDTMILLFFGGLDTVSSVLGFILRDFAMLPDKRREFMALMDDDLAIGDAIEELLRLNTIVTQPRRCTRDTTFNGETFREGDLVNISCPAGNRDPREFDAPAEMRFDRSPNRHLTFGLGRHRCLGIHLARRELRTALRLFLKRCPNFELIPERPPIAFAQMKGVAELWLRRI